LEVLREHYDDVRVEWASASGGTDSLAASPDRYAPRVDLVVGPFNTDPGPGSIAASDVVPKMRSWFEGLGQNPNPRCLLAIEVVYSGSAKHVLGDILNSSVLGLYGLVICSEAKEARVRRNLAYLRSLMNVGKLPTLFQNVKVMNTADFVSAMEAIRPRDAP
jgi:hypothetical protein